MTVTQEPYDDRGQPTKIAFHCGNECPLTDDPTDFDPKTELYPCGYRHWCAWCGDCEFCYGEGPHDWD